MEKKKSLEQLKRYVQELGLTPQEVVKYFSSQDVQALFKEKSSQVSSKKYETQKKVLPGMYVYADGLISSELVQGRQVKAVVGYVEGNTVYAVCLRETNMPWSRDFLQVPETQEMASGKEATHKILEIADKQKKSATAARWCHDYVFDGVKQGEAFLPSVTEWEKLFVNKTAINASLKALGAALFVYGYWSSTEYGINLAWKFNMINGSRVWNVKYDSNQVRPVLVFKI